MQLLYNCEDEGLLGEIIYVVQEGKQDLDEFLENAVELLYEDNYFESFIDELVDVTYELYFDKYDDPTKLFWKACINHIGVKPEYKYQVIDEKGYSSFYKKEQPDSVLVTLLDLS